MSRLALAIGAIDGPETFLVTVKPLTHEASTVRPGVDSIAVFATKPVLTFEAIAVLPIKNPAAMSFSVSPLAFVAIAVCPHEAAFAMDLILGPVAVIVVARGQGKGASPLPAIVLESADVHVAILPSIGALAVHFVIPKRAFVSIPVSIHKHSFTASFPER